MLRPTHGQADLSLDLGGQILDLVKELNIDFGFERSVRLSRLCVQGDRFLVTMAAQSLLHRLAPTELLRWLRFPESLTIDAIQLLGRSTHVHIGVEEDHHSPVLKLYFEKNSGHSHNHVPEGWLGSNNGGRSRTLHVACKWKPMEPGRWVISNYTEPLDEMPLTHRVQRVVSRTSDDSPAMQSFIEAVFDVCRSRCSLGNLTYLDVTEVNNRRASFDLNLYPAALCVSELAGPLREMCKQFKLPVVVRDQLLHAVGRESLGHLAAGVHRNGAPFVTLYHGVTRERAG